jgi:hypothetical protein
LSTVVFSTLQIQRSASLYYQLNDIPDSKKILEKIASSQIEMVTVANISYPQFIDAWKTPIDYVNDPNLIFPVITSAGPDKDFTKTIDNITNRK